MGDPKEGPSPPTWKLMLAKYCGLLPALMIVSYTIDLAPIDPPLWLKLIMETMLVIPLMHYVITPFVDDLFEEWLYAGIDERRSSR